MLTGDVTGDGRSDLLCQVPATGTVAVSTAGTHGAFTASLTRGDGPGLCKQAGSRLLLADVDGNGRADLVCHSPSSGRVAVSLARAGGRFVGTDWAGDPDLCVGSAHQVVAGDVNGDGRADLVCHKPSNGAKQVALATGQGKFPDVDWTGNAGFCQDTTVVAGDLNGDGRTDLLCHRDSGSNAVALAKPDGRFGGAGWQGTLPRCAAPFQVSLGAANADKRADLICRAPLSGVVRMATATKAGTLPSVTFERKVGACSDSSTRFLVGDSSGDKRSDLICHQITTGYVSAFFSDV